MSVFRPSAAALAAAGFVASFVTPAASAAETAAAAPAVTVTAARTEQDLMEVPVSVSVIDSETIRKSSASTVGKLLEDVPGVRLMNDGSQGLIRVSLRGEDAFRTLVLIDGQKISEHKSMSGAPILIAPSAIERIEVIKGPASVLYGSEAIGGVVNIITKKGADQPFSAEASVGWHGASDGLSENVAVAGSAGGFHYRVGGSYLSLGELDTPAGKAVNSKTRQKSGSLYFAYDLTDKLTAGLTADTFEADINSGTIGSSANAFYVKVPEWKRNKAGIFVEARDVSDTLTRLRADVYYQRNTKQMMNHVASGSPAAAVTMDAAADNRINTLGASLQTDWAIGDNHQLITGYEFTQDKLKADTAVTMDMKMGPMNMHYTTDRHNEGSQTTHAVFAQMTSTLPADFTLNYGARYTYVETEMTAASAWKSGAMNGRPYGNLDDGSAGSVGRDHSDRVIFNAGLVWTGIDNLALRAGWSQGYRAPIMLEKYLTTSMGSTHGSVVGNPDLKPETSDTFEFGARWQGGLITADAAVYYAHARDYISTYQLASGISTYNNVASADTVGLEAETTLKLDERFRPYASFTLMHRRFKDSGQSTSKTGDPRFSARFGVKSTFPVFAGTLDTDVYGRTQSSTDYVSTDGTTSYRYGGFTTFNLAAGYAFGKNDMWRVDAELLNVFNKKYQYTGSIHEPGRHANLRVSARF